MSNFTINGNVGTVQIQQECDNPIMTYNSEDMLQTAQTVLAFIRDHCLQQDGIFSDKDGTITTLNALEEDIKAQNRNQIAQRLQTIKTMIIQTGSNVLGSMIIKLIDSGGF